MPSRLAAAFILIQGLPVIDKPPYRRDVGIVFQSYALFPHMTVAENVGYGLRMRKVPAAERATRAVMNKLDYVGVLAFEFFVARGKLLGNEIAPRVHNSGHWTIDGAVCSQFENHLRAVAGLPLGSTAMRGPCAG